MRSRPITATIRTGPPSSYERVAATFVTKDRTEAAFYLRMVERGRDKHRVEVVNDLRAVVRHQGFKPVLIGGIYRLEGELAQLVASSLVTGLLWLFVFRPQQKQARDQKAQLARSILEFLA